MSTEVEQRVVEMQFDNRQFERNVSTTMSSLDKLKQSLNLTGAAKGLENVGTAAKGINLSGLTNAAETVCVKFSHMQMTIQHELNKIVDHALYTGKRIASALTIDPIKTGFAEYETQINAVQTILANTKSKGTDIGDVNAALDELNTYADKTIYNFTEMTRNIGTFTAAGVDLDKSVTSIKGIANLAAVSGSTSQQASTAMYQLSQALAAGKVQLMDWNSVVNAGMGGEVFQEALKRTATNMGKNVDAMIKKYGSFRESLTQGEWLTADVLTETLTQLSGAYTKADLLAKGYTESQANDILELADTAVDAATKVKTFSQLWDTLKEAAQSGWTQTWEILVGDFEEAKESLTKVSDVLGDMINRSSEARNSLLEDAMTSNWDKLVTKINDAGIKTSDFESTLKETMKSHDLDVKAIIKQYGSLEEAFKSGAVSSDILSEAVGKLSAGFEKLSSVERTLKKGTVGEDVKAVQSALKALGYDLGEFGADGKYGKITKSAVEAFQKANNLKVTGIVDDKTLEALEKAGKNTNKLSAACDDLVTNITQLGGRDNIIKGIANIFEALMRVVRPIGAAFKEIFPPMTAERLVAITESFKNFTERLKLSSPNIAKLKTTFKGIFSVLDIGWTVVKELAGGAVKLLGALTGLGGGVLSVTSNLGEWLVNLRNAIKNGNIFGTVIDKIVGFASNLIGTIKGLGTEVRSAFTTGGALEGFFQFLRGIWNVIKQIGLKVGEIFAPLGKAIGDLFQNGNFTDILNDGIFAAVLVGIYKFVDNLNGPLGSLKDLFDGISGEDGLLGGLKETLDSVRGCFEAYQNSLKADILKKIAVAIAILAASLFVISSIDGDALDRSLGAIGVLFAELIASLALFSELDFSGKGLVKGVAAVTGLAGALLVLAVAMKIMSTMSWEEIGVGIVGTVAGLTALVTAVNFMPEGKVNKAAKAVRTLATALLILAAGMKIMGSLNGEEMAIAIAGVASGLFALVTAVNLLPKDTGLRSLGMVGLATSMVILGGAMKIMASMSWDGIAKGLAAMGGAMLEIGIAMNLMPRDTALRSLGMVALATSMVILGTALKSMGGMSWEEIAKGLAVMGGALLELGLALTLMTGTLAGSAALLVAAAALAILAPVIKTLGEMSWSEIGKGLVTLAGAFAVIGVAGLLLTPLVPTLISLAGAMALFSLSILGLGVGILALSAGFTALAAAGTVGATAVVAAIAAIVVGVIDLIPTIVESLASAIVALCDVLISVAPKLADTLLIVVTEIMASLAEYTPQIVDSLLKFLIGVMDALAENLPQLIASAVNLIGAFFTGIVDALSGIDTSALLKGIAGAGLLAALIFALSALTPMIPGAMAGVLGMGVIIAELAAVLAAIGLLAQIPGLEWLIGEGGDLLQAIGTAIGQFVGGLIGGIAEGATSTLPQIGTNLSNFMTNLQPFITGMAGVDSTVLDNAKALASAILTLTAADLLKGIADFFTGGNSLEKFGTELASFGKAMKSYSAEVAGLDTEAVNVSVNAAKDLVKMAKEIPSDGLFGTDGIDDFGKDAIKFGKRIKEYASEVAGIDTASIETSVKAAKGLVSVAKQIPDDGTFGTDGIDNFGDNIVDFAKSIKKYADKIADISIDTVNKSVSVVRSLINVINSMVGMDSSGVKTFTSALNDLSKANFDGVIDTFTTSASKLTLVGKNMFEAVIKGATSMKANFVTATRAMIIEVIDVLDGMRIRFKVVGIETISQFINGVLSGKARVSTAFESAISGALTAIATYRSSFYDAGAYLVSGFANGIGANSYKAAAKARAMAAAAASAARKELDEHSPSRVGYGIGDYFGIAFVNAIADNVKRAYNASANLANAAETGLKGAFDKVSRIMTGEVDVAPTIKPVVDLTNVKSGVDSINGMFGLHPSMDVLANVSAVSSMMNQRSQNGGSDDIVSAINKLGKLLENAGSTTNVFQGITYDDGSNINTALGMLARAILIEGRV